MIDRDTYGYYDADEEAYAAAAEADLERRMEEAYMAAAVSVKLTRNDMAELAELVDREIETRKEQREFYHLQDDQEGAEWCNNYITILSGILAKL